jgi:PEP-CTERM motif
MKFNTSLIAVALTIATSSALADQVFNEATDLPITKNFGLFVLQDLGSFTDTINFGLVSSSTIKAVSVSNVIPNTNVNTHDWHISNAWVQLYDATNTAIGSSWAYDGDTGLVDHNYNLDQGSYYFKVTGVADGNGLKFNNVTTYGNYTFAVTSVPEPESFAMIMAGISLMGLVISRRRA